MEINEDVKIEHGLRTTTLAKFFFFFMHNWKNP